jgi:acyl carrier protein
MEMDARFDEKIMALIAGAVPGKFKKTKITHETHLQKELGLDSIGVLALVFTLEESFEVDIAEMGVQIDIAKLKTVNDIIKAGRDIMSQAV